MKNITNTIKKVALVVAFLPLAFIMTSVKAENTSNVGAIEEDNTITPCDHTHSSFSNCEEVPSEAENYESFEDAVRLFAKQLDEKANLNKSNSIDFAVRYQEIAYKYFKMKEYSQSLDALNKAIAFENQANKTTIRLGVSYFQRATIYNQIKDYQKAVNELYKALNVFQKHYGSNHPQTSNLYKVLANMYKKLNEQELAKVYATKSITNDAINYGVM